MAPLGAQFGGELYFSSRPRASAEFACVFSRLGNTSRLGEPDTDMLSEFRGFRGGLFGARHTARRFFRLSNPHFSGYPFRKSRRAVWRAPKSPPPESESMFLPGLVAATGRRQIVEIADFATWIIKGAPVWFISRAVGCTLSSELKWNGRKSEKTCFLA